MLISNLAPPPVIERVERDPCLPSPCGLNSQCRNVQGVPSCTCLPDFLGAPPNCRPECTISAECPSNLACIRERCIDPCPGSCGYAAECSVVNHTPICVCPAGFTGDPFSSCRPAPPPEPTQSKKLEKYPNMLLQLNQTTQLIGEYVDPCNPSPCGPNAQCNAGICTCLAEFHGDPYSGCRPECVLNSDCPRDKACHSSKCVNPCPGTCGENAICDVINHIPMCRCPERTAGSAFIRCSPVQSTSMWLPSSKARLTLAPIVTVSNPCRPSPCGPNSQCREVNQQAVCSCLPSFIGAPPSCRPECTSNSECAPTQACLNQRCGDPCPGTCGVGANCAVVSHSPFCTCPERFTGNPFIRCQPQSKTTMPEKESSLQELPFPVEPPVRDVAPVDPCRPSPCGPYSQCRPVGEAPACSCVETYIGRPPNCRPECVTSSDCSSQLACVNQKCVDPCPGRCGLNAECFVVSHAVQCICQQGFNGDPFVQCKPEIAYENEIRTPCSPSPCGPNAVCRDRNGVGSCQCLPQYFGDPYEGCRPECMLDSDCPSNRACQQLRCQDPCPGTCGLNANCQVVNHLPTCTCLTGYVGDPYRQCNRLPERKPELTTNTFPLLKPPILAPQNEYVNPCQPTPCGPNSQCRVSNEQAVCSCLPLFVGTPPSCRPECTISSECSADRACVNQKCVDPCAADTCGNNAICRVRNHSPICSCISGYTGDAFTRCFLIPRKPISYYPGVKYSKPFRTTAPIIETKDEPLRDPCIPTPCGPNSECRNINGVPACSCLVNFIGQAPNCRPECTINSECPSQLACINQKCRDPCPGACGQNAVCSVINHTPLCACIDGYIGNPFTNCNPKPPERRCLKRSYRFGDCLPPSINLPFVAPAPPVADDPCNPSPCGANALCRNGQCSCIPEYQGDPYVSCRPECVLNTDCPRDRACVRNKCIDPCPGTCGVNALCEVNNHIPICRCPEQMSGNAFFECRPVPPAKIQNPCQPSPCGPNSQCRVVQQTAVCSCLANYVGSPPQCRPECVTNSDCPADQDCQNMKCRDPCPGTCGFNALCNVVNHRPFCSCPTGMSGNPFVSCQQLSKTS